MTHPQISEPIGDGSPKLALSTTPEQSSMKPLQSVPPLLTDASIPVEPYSRNIPTVEQVPPSLRDKSVWVCWRVVWNPGKKKPDKIPVSPHSGRSDGWATDPNFPSDLHTAIKYAHHNSVTGLGVLLVNGCGISAIDLDDCRSGDKVDEARRIISEAASYTELSPGLNGYRVFFRGNFGGHTGAKPWEFYEDAGNRWLTFTGLHIADTPIDLTERDLSALGARYYPKVAEERDSPSEALEYAPVDIEALPITDELRTKIRTAPPVGMRSDVGFAVMQELVKSGCTAGEIYSIFRDHREGIGNKAATNGNKWLEKEVQRNWSKGSHPPEIFGPGAAVPLPTGASLTPLPPPAPAVASFGSDLGPDTGEEIAFNFWIRGIVPEGQVTLMAGHGGSGKSMLALLAALHISTGRVFNGFPTRRGKVLFYSAEDGYKPLRIRMRNLCRAYSIKPQEFDGWLTVTDASDCPAPLWINGAPSIAYNYIERRVRDENFDVIFIDNTSEVYAGEENARAEVAAFIRALRALVSPREGAVILLSHVDKNTAKAGGSTEGYSGSSAWNNSVRSRLYVASDENKNMVIEHQKSNYGPLNDPFRLQWLDGVPRPFTTFDQAKKDEMEISAICSIIADLNKRGETVSTSVSGSRNVFIILSNESNFPQGVTLNRLKIILRKCEDRGLLRKEWYRNPSRHMAEKWICVDPASIFSSNEG